MEGIIFTIDLILATMLLYTIIGVAYTHESGQDILLVKRLAEKHPEKLKNCEIQECKIVVSVKEVNGTQITTKKVGV